MASRFRTPLALTLVVTTAVVSPLALAAPKEAGAQKLDKEAMNTDYLNVNFAAAEAKLRKALAECGGSACSPKLRAQLQIHLGIILVNEGKVADGTATFGDALKIDPSAGPEADFASADVTRAFDDAKKQAGGGRASEGPGMSDAAGPSSASVNNLTHTPVTEQHVNTPVPLYAEGDSTATKMTLFYKAYGTSDFTKVEMTRTAKGFGASVPCKDVSTAGTLQYYIVASDSSGDPIGNAGSRKDPFKVQIKSQISGEPPHLPGKEPPAHCVAASDCPPGINQPGCEAQKLGYGSKCTGPNQCDSGLLCSEGVCQPRDETTPEAESEEDTAPYSKNLVSLSISPDIVVISGDDLCSAANQTAGSYSCFRDTGKQYQGNPRAGRGGALNGFVRLGTARAMLGYDRAVSPNFLLGARAGFAFGGGPQPEGGRAFLPFHAELRGTYMIGKNPLAHLGARPYVFVNGGLAQVDAKIPSVSVPNDCKPQSSRVEACSFATADPNGSPTTAEREAHPVMVDAWKKLGTSFAGAGIGMMYGFSKSSSLTLDLKAALYFSATGVAISPALGYVQGF